MRRLLAVLGIVVTTSTTLSAAAHAAPDTESAYADGATVTIAAMHFITAPSPQQVANAPVLYIAAYPASGDPANPVTLASGTVPNCNPCFHPGLPDAFVHHDHVLSGAPTLGDSATPRHLILVMYAASVETDPSFRPLTSVSAVQSAEGTGLLQAINPGAANPYEIDTGVLVVTPTLSGNA